MKSIRIDLHTHSVGSPDGGLSSADYAQLLANKQLDVIAITDHDRIDVAEAIQKELGANIIVGEEITTTHGEIIGLYLTSRIAPGLSPLHTAEAIKKQGGLVYIPHPFETDRRGIDKDSLAHIAHLVDIVEVHNGRALFQNKGPQAAAWARMHNKPGASSSDAHGIKGVGTSYTAVTTLPTAKTLADLLHTSEKHVVSPPLMSLLYPKYNRLRGKLKRKERS